MKTYKRAFLVRTAPSGNDKLKLVLERKEIFLGWSLTEDSLLSTDQKSSDDYKSTLKKFYQEYNSDARSLGYAAGVLWRFNREMQVGDLVLIPIPKAFYVAEVASAPHFDSKYIPDDTAVRRKIIFLNMQRAIERTSIPNDLRARLKYQGACAEVTDLLPSILKVLNQADQGIVPNYHGDLRENLIEQLAEKIRDPKAILGPDSLEQLICSLFLKMGATAWRNPTTKYKKSVADADVVADFADIGLRIYAQAKHHSQGQETDEHAVNQVAEAIELDRNQDTTPILGWAITTGKFSTEAIDRGEFLNIRCVDGDELAELLVKYGVFSDVVPV